MSQFTIDDLRRVMRGCAGVDESIDLDSDILDSSFDELGYDSLALLETTAKIQQEFGVEIPDDSIPELATPRKAVDYVNERLTAS